MTDNKFFSKAREYFQNGDYARALKIYEDAGNIFGESTVRYNVALCRAELNKTSVNDEINKIKKYQNDGKVCQLRQERPVVSYEPFKCREVELPKNLEDYYTPPKTLPKDFKLPPLTGLANDYSHLISGVEDNEKEPVTIVILTYNRTVVLEKTLAGIVNQNYPLNLMEIVVVDDGGSEDVLAAIEKFSTEIDIKYVWHKDIGFTPAAARNNGVNIARNDFIILLDVDMYPTSNLVREYVKYSKLLGKAVLIGPRRYIDLNDVDCGMLLENKLLAESRPDVITNNDVAGRTAGNKSVDWRLEVFESTDMLKNEKVPFRVFASGNVAFSRKKFLEAGKFNERFNSWGFEDTELGYRFFNEGLYMIPVMRALALHQEPEGGENETDRSAGKDKSKHLFADICPYYRHLVDPKDTWEVPKVSIYIPAYNAQDTILDAVESVLSQTFKDIEVCICDDGSTDDTIYLLEKYYGNDHRVRWYSQKNGGIGAASNTAVKMCRGIYIGQLDSDDYLAEDVVEKCVAEMDKDLKVGLVYTTYENEYADGSIVPGYNYPVYLREKLITAMIAHHFRMFRKLYWCRTDGFNDKIKNAVDFDMYLKISEVCDAKHLNIIGYRRRLHGDNTSIRNFGEQMKNTAVVVNHSLNRLNVEFSAELESEDKSVLVFKEV